jgi:hypothetical protein
MLFFNSVCSTQRGAWKISSLVFLWQSYKKNRDNDMYGYLFVMDSIWSLSAATVCFCALKLYTGFVWRGDKYRL